jgi:hypothetical protein
MMFQPSLRISLTAAFISLALVPLLLAGAMLGGRSYHLHVTDNYIRQAEVAQRVANEIKSLLYYFKAGVSNALYVSAFANLDSAKRYDVMQRIVRDRHYYREALFFDAEGNVLQHVSNVRLIEHDDNIILHDTVRLANILHSSGTPYYSEIYYDKNNNEPLISLTLPIYDLKNNRISGGLLLELRFKPIWEILTHLKLAQG